MDRERARASIGSGLLYTTIAMFVFGLAFYITILYL